MQSTHELMFSYDKNKIEAINQSQKYKFISNKAKALFMAEKMRVDFVYNTVP